MTVVKVGANVDSWCTRCKLMLAHTVEAIVAGKVTRVHCNTCGAQHAYRQRAPGQRAASGTTRRAAGTRSARSAKAAPAPLQAEDYQRLISGRDASTARPYRLQEHFTPKELIAHPTFGLGLVTAAKGTNKIEVLFPDGLKLLLQGR